MEIQGTCDPAFAPAGDAFARCFQVLGETGAAVCVYVDGKPVVDLWAGDGDAAAGRAWRHDTLVHLYSVSKPFAALCLLLLVDRGAVDLDAPVASYWPEFAQAGKDAIPVRWLLTHQAGLLGIRAPQPREAMLDWERVTALLAAEAPWWQPGTRHGEHAAFFGHLVGELVRRVDGRSLGRFLREEVAEPWELDVCIGLTAAEQRRCATVRGIDAAWRSALGVVPGSQLALALDNPPAMLYGKVVNGAAWRAAEVPAVNAHGTAHGVARFYGGLACGGVLDGRRLLSAALLDDAVRPHTDGDDVLLRRPVSWGLGFQIDTDGFGMGGLGGALGWGNRAARFGFGYVTNRMAAHDRALAVYDTAARLAGIAPVIET